jgi:hypothetical protein
LADGAEADTVAAICQEGWDAMWVGPLIRPFTRLFFRKMVDKGVMSPKAGVDVPEEEYRPEDWRIPPKHLRDKDQD